MEQDPYAGVPNGQDPFVRKVYLQYGPYGYNPTFAAPIVFTIVFGLSCILHTYQAISKRQLWLLVLSVGTLSEATGNGIRIYGHFHQRVVNPYIAQQVLLVVTPVFFAAIHFAILGKVLMMFGRKYSLVNPKFVIPFFVTLDVVSLVVQGAGSGLAGAAETVAKDVNPGGNVVVGGLVVQLIGYLLADTLAISFAIKASKEPHHPLWTPKFKMFLAAAFLSALCVLARSSFRLAEMAVGWIGRISTTEWMYYAFDATPVALSVLLLNLYHPGDYLPRDVEGTAEELSEDKEEKEGKDIEKQEPSENGSPAVGSDASTSQAPSQNHA